MISEASAFHTAIFDALCACLNLDKTSAAAIALIHEAYAEPENVPRPPRGRNEIYWTVLQDPLTVEGAAAWNADNTSGTHRPTISATLGYKLIIVCYGPACEANATKIRSFLYLDGFGFPRQILRKAGIYPVSNPPQPMLLHEEEGSLWRRRADLTIQLRVFDEQQAQARASITTAPAVIYRKGS